MPGDSEGDPEESMGFLLGKKTRVGLIHWATDPFRSSPTARERAPARRQTVRSAGSLGPSKEHTHVPPHARPHATGATRTIRRCSDPKRGARSAPPEEAQDPSQPQARECAPDGESAPRAVGCTGWVASAHGRGGAGSLSGRQGGNHYGMLVSNPEREESKGVLAERGTSRQGIYGIKCSIG